MPVRSLTLGLLLGLATSGATASPITFVYTGHIDPRLGGLAPTLGVELSDPVLFEVVVEPETPDLHASSSITSHFEDAVLSSVLSIGTGFRLVGGSGFISLANDASGGFDQFNLLSRLSGPTLLFEKRPIRPDAAAILMQDDTSLAFNSDAFLRSRLTQPTSVFGSCPCSMSA